MKKKNGKSKTGIKRLKPSKKKEIKDLENQNKSNDDDGFGSVTVIKAGVSLSALIMAQKASGGSGPIY